MEAYSFNSQWQPFNITSKDYVVVIGNSGRIETPSKHFRGKGYAEFLPADSDVHKGFILRFAQNWPCAEQAHSVTNVRGVSQK